MRICVCEYPQQRLLNKFPDYDKDNKNKHKPMQDI